jgi:H+/Cl- antiporter ClcA
MAVMASSLLHLAVGGMIIGVSVWGGSFAVAQVQSWRRANCQCSRCGYPNSASGANRCPECGAQCADSQLLAKRELNRVSTRAAVPLSMLGCFIGCWQMWQATVAIIYLLKTGQSWLPPGRQSLVASVPGEAAAAALVYFVGWLCWTVWIVRRRWPEASVHP